MTLRLSSLEPGHTTGGSRRGARRRCGADSSRTVCQQNCLPRERSIFALYKASKTCRLNVPPEARTSEILCKPMGEQNPRLTTGASAVYPRFITETRSALCSGFRPVERRFFVFVNPIHARHVREPEARTPKSYVNRRRNKITV